MYPYSQYQPAYPAQGNNQSFFQYQRTGQSRIPSSPSTLVAQQCHIISQRATNISNEELTRILDQLSQEVENSRSEKKQISNLKDITTVLIRVRQPVLASVTQHKFFSLLPISLDHIFRQWNQGSQLDQNQVYNLRNLVRLLHRLFRDIDQITQYPAWLTDTSVLDAVSSCLTEISKNETFFQKSNKRVARHFIRLFDVYNDYQTLLFTEINADQDKLLPLVEPVVNCLTSNFYLDSFTQIQKSTSLRSKREKFFLTRCPIFLIHYNGSRLEQTTTNLLSTMLPKYTTILDQLMPSVQQWKRPIIRAVNHLLQIVNHGSGNPNVISDHIPFIDHVLNIINVPIFYNNLQDTLSNLETDFIHTAVSLLENFISEPTVLAHAKQRKVTSSFLRLASAKYEPLVLNIYTLLAYTTSEEDIKSMQNPGILLSTVVKGLKAELDKPSGNPGRIVQLIETLKGLVQHDQMKEEILKQNIHLFLLQCASKLPPNGLTLLLETFWSLSFNPDLAKLLRSNPELMNSVQTISKTSDDEGLKKAADGLVWKLVREPAFLDKVAKEAVADDGTTVVRKVIIGADGKEQVITTTKIGAAAQFERVFQYDIMISYCHADKDLIKKIHKFLLSEGFKVWIDLDHMFGPAMNAMADAVENSEFVLLCMSDSYKQSTYCQAEAEYAFGCKRRLVPLIARPGYKADGWLGFMIGARIYVDFGFFDFETACEKLIIEISRQRQRPLPSKVAQTQQPATVVATTSKREEEEGESVLFSQKLPTPYTKREAKLKFDLHYIDAWTESDVLDFLQTHQLNELMPVCDKMNGRALIQLHNMCLSRYNETYTILNQQLQSTYKIILPIATYTKFLSIMEKVIAPPTRSITPSVPSQLMLPPPARMQQLAIEPPISNAHLPYDILITSDVPPVQMMKMVARVGSGWKVKNLQ